MVIYSTAIANISIITANDSIPHNKYAISFTFYNATHERIYLLLLNNKCCSYPFYDILLKIIEFPLVTDLGLPYIHVYSLSLAVNVR